MRDYYPDPRDNPKWKSMSPEERAANSQQHVQEALDSVVKLFESGNVPAAIQKASFPPANVPMAHWSLRNRLICLAHGTEDARGFRQWQEVGRNVKKGAHAFYILRPRIVKDEDDIDEETGEAASKFVGTIPVAVFRVEDTEGEPLDYGLPEMPKHTLLDVAKAWGIDVGLMPGGMGAYGWYSPTTKRIKLATADESTFMHELSHAADDKLQGGLRGGQDPVQEICAELSAAALCLLVGLEDRGYNPGRSFEYIAHYAHELYPNASARDAVAKACSSVVTRVGQIMGLILDTANGPLRKNPSGPPLTYRKVQARFVDKDTGYGDPPGTPSVGSGVFVQGIGDAVVSGFYGMDVVVTPTGSSPFADEGGHYVVPRWAIGTMRAMRRNPLDANVFVGFSDSVAPPVERDPEDVARERAYHLLFTEIADGDRVKVGSLALMARKPGFADRAWFYRPQAGGGQGRKRYIIEPEDLLQEIYGVYEATANNSKAGTCLARGKLVHTRKNPRASESLDAAARHLALASHALPEATDAAEELGVHDDLMDAEGAVVGAEARVRELAEYARERGNPLPGSLRWEQVNRDPDAFSLSTGEYSLATVFYDEDERVWRVNLEEQGTLDRVYHSRSDAQEDAQARLHVNVCRDPGQSVVRKKSADQSVAGAIMARLGGSKFQARTGARDFVADGRSVQFRLGRFKGLNITHVSVTLDPDGTYTMEFLAVDRGSVKCIDKISGLYVEELRGAFVDVTGLRTSL